MSNEPAIPLLVILGPTGSGKTDLSLCVARAMSGEIVNCDSVQVYRGFDIGTAKLPVSERQGIPHRLIDITDPTALFTAADFARTAEAAIREISSRGRVPIVVGGTGFYLRALLNGLSPAPERDDAVRSRLLDRERTRPGSLHRILRRLDPVSAGRIHPNDKNKTLRALEVRLIQGSSLTSTFASGRAGLSGFAPIRIGLDPPRDLLYARLNERTVRMFHGAPGRESLSDEVTRLLSAGVPPDAKPFESLGYKQVLQLLEGKITEEQAIASTQQETRNYAKRQQTWFRREHDVYWLRGFGDDPNIQREALEVFQNSRAR